MQNKEAGSNLVIAPGGPPIGKKNQAHVPVHYKLDGLAVESIDVIKAVLGEDGFSYFCHGCALKYLIRCRKKGGVDDLMKAQDFISWMRANMEGCND